MSCTSVRGRLSAFLDGDLSLAETRAVAAHLEACAACQRHWRSLRASLALLTEMPRVAPAGAVAWRVLDRLEVEKRGPGLALLFRPAWKARPLLLPSLVPAALVLVSVLAGVLALDRGPNLRATAAHGDASERRLPPSGTEGNPLFLHSGVSVPQRTVGSFSDAALTSMGVGTLFVETVVARDGTVSAVTLLGGDSGPAQPFLDALRRERFEPVRFRGRPVAVSVYRLISRMDVLAPRT